jgi:hypothetical protein
MIKETIAANTKAAASTIISLTPRAGHEEDRLLSGFGYRAVITGSLNCPCSRMAAHCARSINSVRWHVYQRPGKMEVEMANHEGAAHHKKAAEHHEQAAKHHTEAAKHHENDDHETAAHHAHAAAGHAAHAKDHADEAAKHHAETHASV